MSGNLLGDLANASKALNAHRFGVTTAGNNLANVNNPDYARQRVVIGEDGTVNTIFGPRGLGVEVQAFEHMRDTVLDREVLREASIHASLTAQQAALAKAESSLGQEISRTGDSPFIDGATTDSSGSGGIAETLNEFFNSFHSLSANAGSDAEKEALIQKAQILTEKLNVTSERFNDLSDDLTLEAKTDLEDANRIIKEISRLNAEIARAESNHAGQALSLRDQRQALLEDLSEYMQIKVENIEGSAGQIRVYVPTVGGSSPQVDLVNVGRYEQVEFDDSGVSPQFTVKDGSVRIEIKGGSIHGALTARDGAIADYARGLDDLSKEIVIRVNELYNGYKSTANLASQLATKLGGNVDSATIEAAIAAGGAGVSEASIAATELLKDATIGGLGIAQGDLETMISTVVDSVERSAKLVNTGASTADVAANVADSLGSSISAADLQAAIDGAATGNAYRDAAAAIIADLGAGAPSLNEVELAIESVARNQNNFFSYTSTANIGEAVAKELGLTQSASSLQDAIDGDASGATDVSVVAALIHTNLGANSPGQAEILSMINAVRANELSAGGVRLDADLNASTLRTSNSSYELGDNQLTLEIAELDGIRLDALGGRDMTSYYRSVVTTLGENVSKVDSRMEDEEIVFKLLKEQQDSVSGVSIDEEMTDMMKFQRAFEATGKYIKAIDEMLDVIVNRLV